MGSAGRRASTDELLARIDDIVSGHELQRSGEADGAVNLDELDDDIEYAGIDAMRIPATGLDEPYWLRGGGYLGSALDAVMSQAVRQMIHDLAMFGEAMARVSGTTIEVVHVRLSPRFRGLVQAAVDACRPPPVPAKPAQRRRYVRR